MRERIITGLILALVLIPLLFVSVAIFNIVLGIFALYGAYEIIRVFEHKHRYRISFMVYHIIATGFIYAVVLVDYHNGVTINSVLISLLALVVLSLVWYVFDDDLDTDKLAKSWLAILYVGFGFASISMIRAIGLELLGYLLILTMATDIFAYFSGYLFGKRKLAPLISPKKTVEGAIGGTIIAVILATLYRYLMPSFDDMSFLLIVFIGVIVSFLAQIGDLVASKIKRAHEVKDFSNLLPGHGGILDRFDSSIFAAMTLMIVMMILEVF